jgi:hypothetical protein
MKKKITCILICFALVLAVAGCGKENKKATPTAQIGNPWSQWTSIAEAENATGFSFELPEVIGEKFVADVFRTMNGELIEVVYRFEDHEACVRKGQGENQDISGDYNTYETCTEENHKDISVTRYHNSGSSATRLTFSHQGFSWSLVAPNGFGTDSHELFLKEILK